MLSAWAFRGQEADGRREAIRWFPASTSHSRPPSAAQPATNQQPARSAGAAGMRSRLSRPPRRVVAGISALGELAINANRPMRTSLAGAWMQLSSRRSPVRFVNAACQPVLVRPLDAVNGGGVRSRHGGGPRSAATVGGERPSRRSGGAALRRGSGSGTGPGIRRDRPPAGVVLASGRERRRACLRTGPHPPFPRWARRVRRSGAAPTSEQAQCASASENACWRRGTPTRRIGCWR